MLWNNFVPRAFPSKIGWAAPPIFWGKSPGDEVGCERGAKSHVAKKISGRGRRKSRDEKGNHGVGDFRFTNISQLFSIYFFSITLLYHIFFYTFLTHDIYPHPHPRPTTSTHFPRPTTFSYTPCTCVRTRLIGTLWHASAHVRHLDFCSGECFFKIGFWWKNPLPSTLKRPRKP